MAVARHPWHATCMRKKQGSDRTKTGKFARGVSGNPAGRPRADVQIALAHAPLIGALPHFDGWMNAGTGLGMSSRDKTVGTWFETDAVSAEDALQLWRGDAIAARLVELGPNEALRPGFELCIGDTQLPDKYTPPEPEAPTAPTTMAGGKPGALPPKQAKTDSAWTRRERVAIRNAHKRVDAADAKPLQEVITKKMQTLQATEMIRECMHYENAYGGGALLLGANDYTTDLRIPLDLKKVRSLDYLTPLEGRELIPLYYYNDPRQPKFGQVAIYQLVPYIIGASVDESRYNPRVTQIHESRLIIFPGKRVSRRIMISSGTWGWGDSIFTRLIRALRAFSTGHASVEILLSDFAQAVYKIKGLADLISKQGQNALLQSAVSVEMGRSICRAVVIDSEEDFKRESTSLAGYSDALTSIDQYLAACADMPLTVLLGTSPAGLNATGASDIRFFYDRVDTLRKSRVEPALMRIVEIELACLGEDPETTNHSIRFKPLWQPTEKEVADSHFVQAQADAIYITNDVVSAEEIALSRFGGDQYSYDTHVDFEARMAQQAVVAPTVDPSPKPQPQVITGYDNPIPEAAKTPEQRDIVPQPQDG